MQQVREIAQLKMPDLNANDLEAAVSMVAGTARSMGIVVKTERSRKAMPEGRRPPLGGMDGEIQR